MYVHAAHSQAVVVASLCAVGVVVSFSEAVHSLACYTQHNAPFHHSIEHVDDDESTEMLFSCCSQFMAHSVVKLVQTFPISVTYRFALAYHSFTAFLWRSCSMTMVRDVVVTFSLYAAKCVSQYINTYLMGCALTLLCSGL